MTRTLQVLIADDHPLLRAQLPAIVAAQADLEVAGVVANGGAAVEAARALRPDVIVLDLSMPVLDGIAATAQLQALGLAARVVVWTTHEEHSRVAAVQAAGGRGYVLKRSPIEVLLAAIRVVGGGGSFTDPALAQSPAPPAPDALPGPDRSPDILSVQERAVLQHTARSWTLTEIAGALALDRAEVSTLRAQAMDALGLSSRVELVRYAARQGWLEV